MLTEMGESVNRFLPMQGNMCVDGFEEPCWGGGALGLSRECFFFSSFFWVVETCCKIHFFLEVALKSFFLKEFMFVVDGIAVFLFPLVPSTFEFLVIVALMGQGKGVELFGEDGAKEETML